MTRTDATRIFCGADADALAEPAALVADADADGVLLDMLLSSVPVTSTRLPTLLVSSTAGTSGTAEVAAPVVAPAERVDSDELSFFAFVRMNCALFPASD